MSGHSKWHNIQKTKGAADAKRSQIFTKIAREMIVAVKTGGSGKITYFVGYDNVPEIKAEDIIAAYAVAKNTESDSNKKDYWVADVIVIEVDNYDKAYESISLGSPAFIESGAPPPNRGLISI